MKPSMSIGTKSANSTISGFGSRMPQQTKLLQTPSALLFASLATLTCIVFLLLPPSSPLRKALYHVQPLLMVLSLCGAAPQSLRNGEEHYQFGIGLGQWFANLLDRTYFNEPEKAFRRIKDKSSADHNDDNAASYEPGEKLEWAIDLLTTVRGVGWNWEAPGLSYEGLGSRKEFLQIRIWRVLRTLVGLEIISALSDYILDCSDATVPSDIFCTVATHWTSLRALMTWGWIFVIYAKVSLAENVFSIFCVALGLLGVTGEWTEPRAWPAVFGHWGVYCSLRGFWGRTWHQRLRQSCGSLGGAVVRNIQYLNNPTTPRARALRRYVLLLSTFITSAAIHFCGSIFAARAGNVQPSDGGAVKFFVGNAIYIVAEDYIWRFFGMGGREQDLGFWQWWLRMAITGLWAMAIVPDTRVMTLAKDHGFQGSEDMMLGGVLMVGNSARGAVMSVVNYYLHSIMI